RVRRIVVELVDDAGADLGQRGGDAEAVERRVVGAEELEQRYGGAEAGGREVDGQHRDTAVPRRDRGGADEHAGVGRHHQTGGGGEQPGRVADDAHRHGEAGVAVRRATSYEIGERRGAGAAAEGGERPGAHR